MVVHERPVPGWTGPALVLLFILHASAYALAVPVYQSPDEPLHVATIRYVADHRGYPDASKDRAQPEIGRSLAAAHFQELRRLDTSWWRPGLDPEWTSFDELRRGPPGSIIAIAGHPPGYYVALAPLHAVAETRLSFPALVLLLRLATVLLAAPTIWLVVATIRLFSPGRPEIAVGAGAFVALLPQFAHISGSVSNDAAITTLFSAILYIAARMLIEGLSRRLLVAGALVSAAAILVKAQGILTVPILFVAVAVALIRRPEGLGRRRPWSSVLAAVAFPAAVAALWYGIRIAGGLPVTPTDSTPAVADPRPISLLAYTWGYGLPILTRSFWGRFGWLAAPLPSAWYRALNAVAVGSVSVSIFFVVRAAVRRAAHRAQAVLAGLSLAAVATVLGAVVVSSWRGFQHTGLARGLQGRYLFPVVGVIAVLVVGGALMLLPERLRRFGPAGVLAVMGATTLAGMATVVDGFYGGPGISLATAADRLAAYSPVSIAPEVLGALIAATAGTAVATAARFARPRQRSAWEELG